MRRTRIATAAIIVAIIIKIVIIITAVTTIYQARQGVVTDGCLSMRARAAGRKGGA